MKKTGSALSSSKKPIVVIPIPRNYFEREPLWGNAGGYRAVNEIIQAVEEAGGVPRLLFPGDEFEDFEAVILPGGGDVDPAFYGQKPEETVFDTDKELDEFQLSLARDALANRTPLLGICRGMQILNVAAGGTLIQHLESSEEHFPVAARDNPDLRSRPVHALGIIEDSQLAQVLGDTDLMVNSLHHQAADVVPESLRVVARAQDGIVEAVEALGVFQLGVQFHPEDLRHVDSRFQELFGRLIQEASQYRRGI